MQVCFQLSFEGENELNFTIVLCFFFFQTFNMSADFKAFRLILPFLHLCFLMRLKAFFFNSVPTTCFHCIHPHFYSSAVPLNDAHSVSRGKHQKKSAPCYLVRIPPRGALLTDGNKPQPLLLLSLPHFHPTLLQTFIVPTNVIVEASFFFFSVYCE